MTTSSTHADVVARRRQALDALGPRPFTRADGLAAGLHPNDFRSAHVVSMFHGVYRDAQCEPSGPMRCAGALLRFGEGARISHFTAGALLGLPVPHVVDVDVSTPSRSHVRCAGVRVRQQLTGSRTVTVWNDAVRMRIPVTHPADLVVECIRDLTLVDAVVLADAVLHRAKFRASEAVEGWRNVRGVRAEAVRRVVELSNGRAESAMESRIRMLLALAGFPPPSLQVALVVGGVERRLDMAYEDIKVAIEYDGEHHWRSQAQRQDDVEREHALRAAGWEVVHVVAGGVYRDPAGTIQRLVHVMAQRGVLVQPSAEWMAHFPQRVSA